MEENKTGFLESFRKKVLANRIAIESVLFDKDKPKEKEKKDHKHWFYFVLAISIHILINIFYYYKSSGLLSYSDLKSLDYVSRYLNSNLISILTSSDITYFNFDMPLYYLSFIPFVKFFNMGYVSSMFVINSLTIAIISLGIYLLLLESRNKKTALFGVITFLSFGGVFEISRKFSPVLFTMLFVTWSYYLYIKTEKLEKTNLIPIFLIFFSLGFLSDKFFIFYVFPMFGFISYLFTTVYFHLVIKILLPVFLISLIFYIRFIILGFIYYIFEHKAVFLNFKFYFNSLIDFVGIVYFVFLLIFFLWTLSASYMKYEPRKVLVKWLFYPVLLFSIMSFQNPYLIYPCIIPLVVGGSVTVFGQIRKYVLYFTIIIGFLSGLSIIGRIDYNGVRLFGIEKNAFEKYGIKNIILAIKEDLRIEKITQEVKNKDISGDITVSVNLNDEVINYYTLNSIKDKYEVDNIRFVKYPESMSYFSDYVITDKEEIFDSLKGIFEELFKIGKIRVLKKKIFYASELPQNIYKIGEIRIGDLILKDVEVDVFGFDEKKNIADYAIMSANYANYRGIDIYGLKLNLKKFRFSQSFPTFVSGFSLVEILNAKISDFSLIRSIEDNLKLDNFEMEFLKNVVKLKFNFLGQEIKIYALLNLNNNNLYFKVLNVEVGYLGMPGFLCSFMNFNYDLNKSSIPIKLNKIQIANGIIEIK